MSESTDLDVPARYEQWLSAQDAVRGFSAHKLRNLLEILEPIVDGSYGPINPRMIEVYLKTLDGLGRLYGVHNPVPAPKAAAVDSQDPAEAEQSRLARMEELRATAAKQLRQLESRRPNR